MRLGIAHHLGWAVVVSASSDHQVVDRHRIELIELGIPPSPIEHDVKTLGDAAAEALVTRVRASVARASSASLDELTKELSEPIESISLRSWPFDFPKEISVQRRAPWASRADSVMYLEVLAELAYQREWALHLYDAKHVESQARIVLGARAEEILHGPKARLGPPWTKDHRTALAATVVAG